MYDSLYHALRTNYLLIRVVLVSKLRFKVFKDKLFDNIFMGAIIDLKKIFILDGLFVGLLLEWNTRD